MRDGKVFSTGDIAKMLHMAPRTISKFFDSGRLRGYRIPGSNDRRVLRADLERFLKANGLPTDGLEAAVEAATPYALIVGAADQASAGRLTAALAASGFDAFAPPDAFALGLAVARRPPAAVVIDAGGLGRAEGMKLMLRLKTQLPECRFVAVAGEDDPDAAAWLALGVAACFRRPMNPAEVAAAVAGKDGE